MSFESGDLVSLGYDLQTAACSAPTALMTRQLPRLMAISKRLVRDYEYFQDAKGRSLRGRPIPQRAILSRARSMRRIVLQASTATRAVSSMLHESGVFALMDRFGAWVLRNFDAGSLPTIDAKLLSRAGFSSRSIAEMFRTISRDRGRSLERVAGKGGIYIGLVCALTSGVNKIRDVGPLLVEDHLVTLEGGGWLSTLGGVLQIVGGVIVAGANVVGGCASTAGTLGLATPLAGTVVVASVAAGTALVGMGASTFGD